MKRFLVNVEVICKVLYARDVTIQKVRLNPFLIGCKNKDSAKVPDGCYACRFAMDAKTKTCIARCPRYKTLTREKLCVRKYEQRQVIRR